MLQWHWLRESFSSWSLRFSLGRARFHGTEEVKSGKLTSPECKGDINSSTSWTICAEERWPLSPLLRQHTGFLPSVPLLRSSVKKTASQTKPAVTTQTHVAWSCMKCTHVPRSERKKRLPSLRKLHRKAFAHLLQLVLPLWVYQQCGVSTKSYKDVLMKPRQMI